MANSKLTLAMLAGLNQRALLAAFDSGRLSKGDFQTILALRANGSANEVIAKHVGRRVLGDRKFRKIKSAIAKYATQRVIELQKKEKPMTTTDIVARRVEKARETVSTIREAIAEYAKNHPGANREDVLSKVLYSRPVADLHKHDVEEMAKTGSTGYPGNLPQQRPVPKRPPLPMHRATTDVDLLAASPSIYGQTGYDSSVDGRPPGRAHASGGPQSGKEDQPVIEDHNQVMSRSVKTNMAAGMSYSKAVNAAADSDEFKRAFKAWKAKQGY